MSKDNNLTDFLTDVADAIREKKGTTDLINPQYFSDEIKSIYTGKEQPTLFEPIINVISYKEIYFENNEKNGAFDVIINADIDGVRYEAPILINKTLDGKTLVVTANSENFNSSSETLEIQYIVETLSNTAWKMNREIIVDSSVKGKTYIVNGHAKLSNGSTFKISQFSFNATYDNFLVIYTDKSDLIQYYPSYGGWYHRANSTAARDPIEAPTIYIDNIAPDDTQIRVWFTNYGLEVKYEED